MTAENIREICLSLKGTAESIKWENHLCFDIGDKMYIITNPDELPVSASIKTSDEKFEELITREGIIPAPYLARHKWVKIDDISRLSEKEWKELLGLAYTLVKEKLPAKIRKQLD